MKQEAQNVGEHDGVIIKILDMHRFLFFLIELYKAIQINQWISNELFPLDQVWMRILSINQIL